MTPRETIFAPATPAGRGGVAVLRISGPGAGPALQALTGRPLPAPRAAALAELRDPADGAPLDRGLMLWFPGPASYTGEDVVELHLHGGRAVTRGVVEALSRIRGLRPAEPGEFTRRAFLAGKLDLTEAEAVADLVDAETRAQRLQALRQLGGALGALYEGWRSALMRALAMTEAALDFPDEGLPPDLAAEAERIVAEVSAAIAAHLDDAGRGERLREGVHIAILGPVNAGKSSLLNALARRDAAIVSDRPGTTRDVVEVALDLRGFPVVLADTAGLRETADEIEAEGIRRSHRRAAEADLRLVIRDAVEPMPADPALGPGPDTIRVLNKIDRTPDALRAEDEIALSVRTGAGLDRLLDVLAEAVERRLTGDGSPALTRARHRAALEDAREALARVPSAPLPELAAEDLRLALRAIGRITGRVDVEDMLDLLFGSFCIGK
ncbi:tRNA uridine-5-carboxymethylaminomethyl(34) synthesis GTPase MnmE [Mycobacterium sp. KBS0706]|uniref:tRNA uridine-5-carboxymethylaminomethyl(34) synthesis GTPase MnmE n=1 Tax=Mycobacterium sp. KBS0706 TaxID=2578109 RepID=UPI00110FF42C|nr:tRNA uridine-5-carboxymethylaminomethyl(34) synthesis GTPase MnmE [Mycobacterium sp. KBS0706]TSD88975.1 tRNA uridine-5-carboxymethylaminomethyl(34) synthesis GTPase MnmE [Mycobacterium sp. KBS0706]